MIQSDKDVVISSEPVLHICHSEDDLHLIGFTFDEVQVVSLRDGSRELVPMSFDHHNNTLVLSMMRGMSCMPGLGLVTANRRCSTPFLSNPIGGSELVSGCSFNSFCLSFIYLFFFKVSRPESSALPNPQPDSNDGSEPEPCLLLPFSFILSKHFIYVISF